MHTLVSTCRRHCLPNRESVFHMLGGPSIYGSATRAGDSRPNEIDAGRSQDQPPTQPTKIGYQLITRPLVIRPRFNIKIKYPDPVLSPHTAYRRHHRIHHGVP